MDSYFMIKVQNKPASIRATNQSDNLFETFDFFAPKNQPSEIRATTGGTKQKKNDFDLLNL